MPQINFHTAVAAQAKTAQVGHLRRDFSALVGLIKPKQPGRFNTDDVLWETDMRVILVVIS